MENASVNQVVQLGVEAAGSPGTSVAANRKLQSYEFDLSPKAEVDEFTPSGYKYPTIAAAGREWTEAKLSGPATFSEIVYVHSGCLAIATPVQIGTTGAYTWAHTPSSTAEDTVKTYTVEMGSTARARKFSYGLVNGFTLKLNRKSATIEASMLGQRHTDGITMAAGATGVEQVPVLGKQFDVYYDATSVGLGTTKLTRLMEGELAISGRFKAGWFVDSSKLSFSTHVEGMPKGRVKVKVMADAVAGGMLDDLRAGTTRFLRLKALGANIGVGADYTLQYDLAVKVVGIGEYRDADGVFAVEYTLGVFHDETWGKHLVATTVNKLVAL